MNNAQRAAARQERIKVYNSNPKICPQCDSALTYDNRNYRYCSLSCGAKHRTRPSKTKVNRTITCVNCNAPASHRNKKFCSSACQQDYAYITKTRPRILEGKVSEPMTLKRFLGREGEAVCKLCGITHWQGEKLSLQLDHIDGNASNNLPDNLRLICPNCHSLTPSYTGRNRGFGRQSLGIKRKT